MPTFKAEIQNKRQDGTYNVRIRVTHNREVRRLSTNLYVTESEVTKGRKIKNVRVVEITNDLIRKCREACNALGMEILDMPIDKLVERLRHILTGGDVFSLDFLEYAERKLSDFSRGTSGSYRSSLRILKRYVGDTLDISEITVNFLHGFEAFIESEPSRRGDSLAGRAKGGRALSLYMGCIRTLYNLAKSEYNDEDRGIINIPYSPFARFKIRQPPMTRKRALPIEKIQAVINLPYVEERSRQKNQNLAKDCFLLSFLLIGMNSTDLFSAPPPADGIVVYYRKKTTGRRGDKAEMRVRIEREAAFLIDKYKDPSGKRMFNFYRLYSNERAFNSAINESLKKIGGLIGVEALTYYAARHSWATIAHSSAVGIDKMTVHEALNHVNGEMKVTDIYIDKDWSVIWNANRKVIDVFDWSELELMYLL